MSGWPKTQNVSTVPNDGAAARRSSSNVIEPPSIFSSSTAPLAINAEYWLQIYSDMFPVAPGSYTVCKRVFDILASVILLLFTMPLLIVISLLIVFETPGWPIYRQLRKGKNQKPFHIYKFRTMVNEAERQQRLFLDQNEVDGILFKLKDDPRITRIGRLLRAYSIDELPQLINVLKGDMSLVGPRPFSLDDFNRSNVEDAVYKRWLMERHNVTPGLTGLWQISGRNDVPFDKLIELDLFYVRHRNALIDAIILSKTVGVVVNRKGAY